MMLKTGQKNTRSTQGSRTCFSILPTAKLRIDSSWIFEANLDFALRAALGGGLGVSPSASGEASALAGSRGEAPGKFLVFSMFTIANYKVKRDTDRDSCVHVNIISFMVGDIQSVWYVQ